MKTYNEVKGKIYEIVEEIADMKVPADPEVNLVQDMFFDSIKIVMLYASIENEYNIDLDFESLDFDKYLQLFYIIEVTFNLINDEA